jgi:MoaA/NifB/PqqE/SkfB family radical SAM enzyme
MLMSNNIINDIKDNSDIIKKIYIEPTTKCNLDCKMCPRNTWVNEKIGDMDMQLFETILNQIKSISSVETVFFGGIAEPVFHRNIIEMIKMVKEIGLRVELVSNGSLLDREKIEKMLYAGLDMLWVSIDKLHSESQEKNMGDSVEDLLEKNLIAFRTGRYKINKKAELGIAFVATKSNINELPEVIVLAARMEAAEIKVSNLIPYTKEMQNEVLYRRSLSCGAFNEDLLQFRKKLSIPIMDFECIPPEVMGSIMRSMSDLYIGKNRIARDAKKCKFIEDNSLFIRWDGEVCPCLALLHNNKTYLNLIEREVKFCSYGNVKEEKLSSIWEKKEYKDFRKRVKEFSFSPCTTCGLCDYAQKNEEDCFGNTFPTCGGCLWSEGFAQCP